MKHLSASVCIIFVLNFVLVKIPETYSAPTTPNPKIVIIGAGPSGIAAAVKLLEYGFQDVTILEAEPRIGGRIHTIPFADNVIDLGAQWCHGEKNNVAYELAKDKNLFGSTMEIYKNTTYVRSNGVAVPEDTVQSLVVLIEDIEEKRKNDSMPINFSAHDFWTTELVKALERPEYQHIDKKIAAEALASREYEECTLESSDDLTVISAIGDKEYETCEGNQALTWKDKGYKTILEILMKTQELRKEYGVLEEHIRLSKRVKRIDWKRYDNKVLIHCEDGEEILADHVIVTVSLGVLKAEHNTLFEPMLPTEKQTAIEEINFGTVAKIFLEFDKQYWPNDWTGFTILWTEEDLKSIRGTENFWWEGICGFYAVEYQPLVFEVWLIGPFSRHMETLDVNVVKDDCVKIIGRYFEWDVPDPVKNITFSDWFKNPNFRGTYSYHSIKMLESGITPRDLEEPLTVTLSDCENNRCNMPIVQFAGEATSVPHFSTVHGAIETGWREAKRLADFYGTL